MAKKPDLFEDYPPDLKRRLALLSPEEQREWKNEDEKLLANEDLRRIISRSPQVLKARELHKKLTSGELSLSEVAKFLAFLAFTKKSRLPWTVERGLKALGIDRERRAGGRRRGRPTDFRYVTFVECAHRHVLEAGIWIAKDEFKQKYPRSWYSHFRKSVDRLGLTQAFVDLLIQAKTPRSLAIQLAADHYHVSYDAVATACRRAARAAKS